MNKVILVGKLGRDPETRTTGNGMAVANVSLATDEWRNKAKATEWHRLVMFDKLAERAGQYLKKGSSVAIEGKIQTNKWQDKEGNDRYSTEIVCHHWEFAGSKAENGEQPKQEPAGFEPDTEIPF